MSPEHEENYFDDYTDETINPISGTVNYPKKRKKQKSRVLRKYSMDSNGKYLCTEDPSICSRTYVTKQLLTGHIKDFHAGLSVNFVKFFFKVHPLKKFNSKYIT